MSKTRALNHKHAYELADRFAERALRPQKTPGQRKPPARKIEGLRSTRQARPTAEFVNPDAEEQRRRQPWYVPGGDQMPRAERNRLRNRKLKERRKRKKARMIEAMALRSQPTAAPIAAAQNAAS